VAALSHVSHLARGIWQNGRRFDSFFPPKRRNLANFFLLISTSLFKILIELLRPPRWRPIIRQMYPKRSVTSQASANGNTQSGRHVMLQFSTKIFFNQLDTNVVTKLFHQLH